MTFNEDSQLLDKNVHSAAAASLLILSQDFALAYGWNAFSEPLCYTRQLESLAHGQQEERAMLSPLGYASKERFFGIYGRRIFCRLKLLIS